MHLRRLKGRRHFYAEFNDLHGERITRSTDTDDRKIATARGRKMEREANDPAHAAPNKATLADAIRLLKEHYAARPRSQETTAYYERKAGHLARVLTDLYPLARLDVSTASRYIAARRREGASDRTVEKEIATLQVCARLARDAGLWQGDPRALRPAGFRAEYRPRSRWLPEAEARALLAALEPHRNRRAIVAFALATGAELGAIYRAERADIDLDAGLVTVRGTKNIHREARPVPVVLDLCAELLKIAREEGEGKDGRLVAPWPKICRDLRAACVRAKIDPCSANDLRRTFAQWHHRAGVPLEVLHHAMGHRDTTMLSRVYARPDAQSLRAAMLRAIKPAERK